MDENVKNPMGKTKSSALQCTSVVKTCTFVIVGQIRYKQQFAQPRTHLNCSPYRTLKRASVFSCLERKSLDPLEHFTDSTAK